MEQAMMIRELDKAFKAITVGDLGAGVLQPEKFDQYVREMENSSDMLNDARRMEMTAPQKDIDRVGYGTRLLGAGSPTEVKPTFATNSLIAVKGRGLTGLEDDTLEDNIERGSLEDTLIALMGSQSGLDVEELGIQGDTGDADPYIALTDGWNKLAGVQLDGTADADFTANDVESMLGAMLRAMPQQYKKNRSGMRYYVPWHIEDAYRDVLKARGTALGDTSQADNQPVFYKGVRLTTVFNMPNNEAELVSMANVVYGVHRDIRIERDRVAADEITNFYVSVRTDFNFEDESGVVHASAANIPI